MVRTTGFHPVNRSSILRSVTNVYSRISQKRAHSLGDAALFLRVGDILLGHCDSALHRGVDGALVGIGSSLRERMLVLVVLVEGRGSEPVERDRVGYGILVLPYDLRTRLYVQ